MSYTSFRIIGLSLSLIAISWVQESLPTPPEFDLIISEGRIVDGTGNPWFYGDVAIKNGVIVAIGRFNPARAARVIKVKDLIVAPGFIDVHTHIEANIEKHPTADNFLNMGVTSVITGNCGTSALPLGQWVERLYEAGISINVGSLVGHNTIRRQAMNGDFDRAPTSEELHRMRDMVDRAMLDGAVGFSTGLEYVPGTYAKTDEMVELARVSSKYGGLYATHMRNEDETVERSIAESLEVGMQANCPVQISHFKISSKSRWGASSITTRLVEEARARGQQVTVDQYLYTANSTNLGIFFPTWVFDGGRDKTKKRLQDSAIRARVKREIIAKAHRGGFRDFSFAFVANYEAQPSFNGKTISEITKMVRSKTGMEEETEQVIDMMIASNAQMVLHKMSDEDVDRIFSKPYAMVASDGGVIDVNASTVPHPRSFGNNARVLAKYVRERKLLGLEESIRKMTSLPAQTFKLWGRGLIRPGMAADMVIFDEATVGDRATFRQPKQYATGFNYVLVNGQVVIEKGSHNGARPGHILRRHHAHQDASAKNLLQ